MRTHWNRRAIGDLDRIWAFNAERSTDYADRVEARIRDRVAALARFPMLGPPIEATDLRKLSVPDIQYFIVYRIEESVIRIARVQSTAQLWKDGI